MFRKKIGNFIDSFQFGKFSWTKKCRGDLGLEEYRQEKYKIDDCSG
jgi:hypothetical protein